MKRHFVAKVGPGAGPASYLELSYLPNDDRFRKVCKLTFTNGQHYRAIPALIITQENLDHYLLGEDGLERRDETRSMRVQGDRGSVAHTVIVRLWGCYRG